MKLAAAKKPDLWKGKGKDEIKVGQWYSGYMVCINDESSSVFPHLVKTRNTAVSTQQQNATHPITLPKLQHSFIICMKELNSLSNDF